MPSASRNPVRLGALGACLALLGGAASGCSTTQEKAEAQQARAQHILDQRAKRKQRKQDGNSKKDGNEKR